MTITNESIMGSSNASAAAMDALNLDDLFNDDPNDSLFDDMEIDLGDISGVFNDDGGDVLSQEFGRGNSSGSARANATASGQAKLLTQTQRGAKKRGSKVALTHAQIVAKLGIRESDRDSVAPPSAAVETTYVDKDSTHHRIRTRREGRYSSAGVDGNAASKTSIVTSPQAPLGRGEKEEEMETSEEIQHAMDVVSKYGIGPSTTFYPFMRLPMEVELKKGQKSFPCLEKVNHASVPAAEKNSDKVKHANDVSTINPYPKSDDETPLHKLFISHLGSLIDNHGVHHSSVELDKALMQSTDLTKEFLDQSHPMLALLKGELSKLLIGCMKQSAFLRQNLWNMEAHARKYMNKADFKSCFPISRKDIEDVLSSVDREGVSALAFTISPPTRFVKTGMEKKDTASENKSGFTSAATGSKMDSKSMVSVRIKVRVTGWRDKSGRKLVAHFKPPKAWKVATKRAKKLTLSKRDEEEAASICATGVSLPLSVATSKKPVNPATAEAVAAEILQSRLLKPKASTEKKIGNAKKSPSDEITTNETSKTMKRLSRKRKKENTTQSSSPASASPKSSTPKSADIPVHDSFHIPSYEPLHTAVTCPASSPSSKISNINPHSLTRDQNQHIDQAQHTKILHSPLSPTERRNILANEISSTMLRLENAQMSKQISKAQEIQQEVEALEAIYKQDLETVPEMANTIGLWHWLEETNYFREVKKEDVYNSLHFVIGDSFGVDDDVRYNGKHWGALLPPLNVHSNDQDCASGKEETPDAIERLPLFDCLQSLLVEVDGSDDDEDGSCNNDELLSDVPPFTKEQLISGPESIEILADKTMMLNVSALSLEQRTYIQLRVAGLIDTPMSPSTLPRLVEEDVASRKCSTLTSANDVDDVIERMMKDLNKLYTETSSVVSALERAAVSCASQSSNRKRLEREQESILMKYSNLQKEHRDKRRVSGRVKTGPNKFDGTNWLPW